MNEDFRPRYSAAQQLQNWRDNSANQRFSALAGLGKTGSEAGVDCSYPTHQPESARPMLRLKMLGFFAALSTMLAAPAMAADTTTTRLVKCGAESCLKVSGLRTDKADSVFVNGHEVAVKGARRWHASIPVDTVRAWSEPFARTIAVSVGGTNHNARLPIGMMGHAGLAMLVVRVK